MSSAFNATTNSVLPEICQYIESGEEQENNFDNVNQKRELSKTFVLHRWKVSYTDCDKYSDINHYLKFSQIEIDRERPQEQAKLHKHAYIADCHQIADEENEVEEYLEKWYVSHSSSFLCESCLGDRWVEPIEDRPYRIQTHIYFSIL